MTEVLLYLHILLFVFSFAFTAGISIVGDRVAKTRDAAAVHALFSAARPLTIVGGIGWILTALAGGALAGAYGYNMGAPWLVGSYAAFAVLILLISAAQPLACKSHCRVRAAWTGAECAAAIAHAPHRVRT